jgi:hypothetical protein
MQFFAKPLFSPCLSSALGGEARPRQADVLLVFLDLLRLVKWWAGSARSLSSGAHCTRKVFQDDKMRAFRCFEKRVKRLMGRHGGRGRRDNSYVSFFWRQEKLWRLKVLSV